MTSSITSFLVGFLLVVEISCCPPDSQLRSHRTEAAAAESTTGQSKGAQPTTIKLNATLISAVIDSVESVNETDYRLSIRITSAAPVEGMESFAGVEQRIVVMPQYVRSDSGVLDVSLERNRGLMSLRSAKPGDSFEGKISLNAAGKWHLIEVIGR